MRLEDFDLECGPVKAKAQGKDPVGWLGVVENYTDPQIAELVLSGEGLVYDEDRGAFVCFHGLAPASAWFATFYSWPAFVCESCEERVDRTISTIRQMLGREEPEDEA